MQLVVKFFKKILAKLKIVKEKIVAEIVLDDDVGVFVFKPSDLLYIGYDSASQKIIVVVKGQPVKYLSLTHENLAFLKISVEFLRKKLLTDTREAYDLLNNQVETKKSI